MAKTDTKKVVKTVRKKDEKKQSNKSLGNEFLKKLGLKKERRGRPKKRKGFTLIELLAVIVILGLLMAIAIPSVTRYITQSRKKTLTTTIDNYMGALVNEVNSLEYTLTESNTVYAIPIECIALERGGNNPFGEWSQANDRYWAYVLVQYDDENSSYRYGFSFKDSAGYGIYPTAQDNLNLSEKSIKTGLSLARPRNGKVTTLTSIDNWSNSGFKVSENTNLVVLVAESEGKVGNGKTTCTLQKRGLNYAQVEQEKLTSVPDDKWKGDAYALVLDNSANPNDELPLIFVRSETPIEAGDTYKSDRYGNIKVKDAYTDFEDKVYESKDMFYEPGWEDAWADIGVILDTPWSSYSPYITSIVTEGYVRFASMDNLFGDLPSISYVDVGKIDTSHITSMTSVFSWAGISWQTDRCHLGGGCDNFVIGGAWVTFKGLENWDVSNVTDMNGFLFEAKIESLSDISNWDTSNVVNMDGFFASAGFKNNNYVVDLSKWNVDKVDLNHLFYFGDDSHIILPDRFK